MAPAFHLLGNVARALRDFPEARENLRQALEIALREDRNVLAAAYLNSFGALALYQGFTEEAIRLYRLSLLLCCETHTVIGIVNALSNLAEASGKRRKRQ
jgi:tetratricopeptide (TPR) repeat protein